ncbi:glucose-1-phosphate thymidylyltransferase RfbA [Flavobacteriaceae bacterium]|nr:glucose-1-phosphate thymidylyltransferase RfbA [Flavobacteriaceae bacterium]
MKAILLAGGIGTRLFPITLGVSKQLLPVYDKPMIYYPLSVLILAGIREIMIISTNHDIEGYKRLLGDGRSFGINLHYKIQDNPNGLVEAFIIGEDFIGKDPVCLILGDNIFYGLDFSEKLKVVVEKTKLDNKGTIFGYTVKNPERYGVIEFDSEGIPICIEEKPKDPKSNHAVVGLYFYPNEVVKVAKMITPSGRGELEISTLNNHFLKEKKLQIEFFSQGFTWLDTGTPESLLEAGQFIETIENRKGIKVGCLEEVAYKKGYINKD